MKTLIIAALAPFVVLLWLAGVYYVAFGLFEDEAAARVMTAMLGFLTMLCTALYLAGRDTNATQWRDRG